MKEDGSGQGRESRGEEKEERMHLDCSIGVGGHIRRLG